MWEVKLPRFEGPLDLLLFLVSRQEYDIMDLPMAEITESYLAVIDSIGVENLEDAGEYVLMAATLLAIKVKMLLPRPAPELMEHVTDPRRELVDRLLIYQKTKDAAEILARREAPMLERWSVGRVSVPESAVPASDEALIAVTLYDLTRAMEEVLARKDNRKVHQVRLFRVSVEDRIRWVLALLDDLSRFGLLRHLRNELDRMIWVVSLLAILELAKRQQVHIEQNEPFSELYVSRAVVPELETA